MHAKLLARRWATVHAPVAAKRLVHFDDVVGAGCERSGWLQARRPSRVSTTARTERWQARKPRTWPTSFANAFADLLRPVLTKYWYTSGLRSSALISAIASSRSSATRCRRTAGPTTTDARGAHRRGRDEPSHSCSLPNSHFFLLDR